MDLITVTKSDLLHHGPQAPAEPNLSSRTWGEWASEHKGALTACAALAVAAVGFGAWRSFKGNLRQAVSEGAALVVEPIKEKVIPAAASGFDKEAALAAMRNAQMRQAAVESGVPLASDGRMWQPVKSLSDFNAPFLAQGVRASRPLALHYHPEPMIAEELGLQGGAVETAGPVFNYHPENASAAELLAHGLHGPVVRNPKLIFAEYYVESEIPHGMRPLMDEMVRNTHIATAETTFSQHMPAIAVEEMPVFSLFKRKPPG